MSDDSNERATAQDIIEAVRRQRQAAPELAKQKRQRTAHQADGDIHAVSRATKPSLTQDAAAAHEVQWPTSKRYVRASTLPAIEPPPGYHIRWARISDKTRHDQAGLMRYLREGWVPARPAMFKQQHLPTTRIAQHGDVIGNDDSILMICTIDMHADHLAQNRSRTQRATQGIHADNNLANVVTPQMPLVENVNRVKSQLHRLRKVQPAAETVAE